MSEEVMTKILIDRATAEQALEALKEFGYHGSSPRWERTANALKNALEQQPVQEPVAWLYPEGLEALQAGKCWTAYPTEHEDCKIPLYTTPQQQQAEPPPEWPLIKNILAVFGLDAISFVAKWQAAQQQAEPAPIYYMRDNHTFKKLSAEVSAALVEIESEFNAGYTYGSLISKREGFPQVHASGSKNRLIFFRECKTVLEKWSDAPPKQQAEPDLIPQDKLFVCGQMGANITRVTVQPPLPVQPVQEPVTWDKPSASFNAWWDSDRRRDNANPFTTDSFAFWAFEGWQAALAQRQWVGLTDVDVKNLELTSATSSDVRNIAAELKEKNT